METCIRCRKPIAARDPRANSAVSTERSGPSESLPDLQKHPGSSKHGSSRSYFYSRWLNADNEDSVMLGMRWLRGKSLLDGAVVWKALTRVWGDGGNFSVGLDGNSMRVVLSG